MPRVVLLTGVSQFEGSRLAGRLAADPEIARVIGVDVEAPARAERDHLGRTEFVRADIRGPLIGRLIEQADVDTVVHTCVAATPRAQELNVVGTMQLLAACQRSETVRRLVLRSTTEVYGSSPRAPAVFTEQMSDRDVAREGFGKDAFDVEGYFRGFARRRPDVVISILRLADVIGPSIDTPLTRYLARAVVATTFGFDPRLQLLHEADAVEALRRAAVADHPGVFNVAGRGVLTLTQAIRRAGRVELPLPAARRLELRLPPVGRSVQPIARFGRVVDTTSFEREFPGLAAHTTAEAFESFITGRPVVPVVQDAQLNRAARVVAALLGAARD